MERFKQMSVVYVANENGDWWTMDTKSGAGQTLFVITPEELKKKALAEGLCWEDDEVDDLDKLEDLIQEHGEALQFKKQEQEAYNQGVQDALEEMSQLFEGVTDTDLWAETFK